MGKDIVLRCKFKQNKIERKIDEIMKTLDCRERRFIELYYGIAVMDCYNYKEIGLLYGITSERVREIIAKARRKLRHPSRKKPYLEIKKEYDLSKYNEEIMLTYRLPLIRMILFFENELEGK
jgi:hypothetical protein